MTLYYEEEFITPHTLQTNGDYLRAGGPENPANEEVSQQFPSEFTHLENSQRDAGLQPTCGG